MGARVRNVIRVTLSHSRDGIESDRGYVDVGAVEWASARRRVVRFAPTTCVFILLAAFFIGSAFLLILSLEVRLHFSLPQTGVRCDDDEEG